MSLIAIIIGFYGYLFPGNINIMIMELYKTKRYFPLIFSLLIVLICESSYCYFTLQLIDNINTKTEWYIYLQNSAFLVSLLMGIWMMIDSKPITKNKNSGIYRGLISAVIHPQQIPFWLFVGLLFNNTLNGILSNNHLMTFVLLNALGVTLILLCYATLGNKLITLLNIKVSSIKTCVGVFFIFISTSSLYNSLF